MDSSDDDVGSEVEEKEDGQEGEASEEQQQEGDEEEGAGQGDTDEEGVGQGETAEEEQLDAEQQVAADARKQGECWQII